MKLLTRSVLAVCLAAAFSQGAFGSILGPGTGISTTNDEGGGTRNNVSTSSTLTLPAGTYNIGTFDFVSGISGQVQPYIATSSGGANYTVVAAGANNVVSTTGTQSVPFGGSATQLVLNTPTQLFGGIINAGPDNPVRTQLGAGTTDHNNPGGSASVGTNFNSFTNAGLNRQYAFGINLNAAAQQTNSSQNGVAYAVGSSELNLGIAGVASPGGVIASQEGSSSDINVLSNGTNGAGDFSDLGSQVVTINNNGSITYTLPQASNLSAIRTFSVWRDSGRINQDYIVSTSTDGVNFNALATVNFDNPVGGSNINSQVALTPALPGSLATNVIAVRFTFGTVQNGFVGFTELGIFGTPVPEPSTCVLAGLGAIGLAIAARRRKS